MKANRFTMDPALFQAEPMGELVTVTDGHLTADIGQYQAFVPSPLLDRQIALSPKTNLAISEARAALAALDATARQLPNPGLLRIPALRLEAQSTSELEGTYAPLAQVLFANEDGPNTAELVQVLNYVEMAKAGFDSVLQGWPINRTMVMALHGLLMKNTPQQSLAGTVRQTQVVIGVPPGAASQASRVQNARFVPPPPGPLLEDGLGAFFSWLGLDHSGVLDPVVAAGMTHYQFETLHPFPDGNGRVGRFLIVLQLLKLGVLTEPTLTVSPWFEARRSEYYDRLFAVSTQGDWDSFLSFFAAGLAASARTTKQDMLTLLDVQRSLCNTADASTIRSINTHRIIDYAVANPTFTLARLSKELNISIPGTRRLVNGLVELGILDVVDPSAYRHLYFAPQVIEALTDRSVA